MPGAVGGCCFSDQSLLVEVLTHYSHPEQPSDQRLEFVGGSALSLVFTNFLHLHLGPGPLSVLRAANVSSEKFARVTVSDFTDVVMKERDEDIEWMPCGGNTVKAPKVMADIVESIAASVYVDSNFNLELLWKVFRGLLEPIITLENMGGQPVATLHVLCQKQGRSLDIKNWRKASMNITNVSVDGDLVGIGSSEQKPIAKLNAARDALQDLSTLQGEGTEVDRTLTGATLQGDGEEVDRLLTGAEEKDGSKQK